MRTMMTYMVAAIIGLSCPAFGHAAEAMGDMHGAFMKTKAVDGYTVTFHIMKSMAGQKMGGDHAFMVKVEKGGRALAGLIANSKVIYPDKSTASKMMMRMGDWQMAGYDMDQKGQYQLMVLFKTPDGKKHFGGIYYPQR